MDGRQVEEHAAYVRETAPRLTDVTNLTVISFCFLERAIRALEHAQAVGAGPREVIEATYQDGERIAVVRLSLLLDRDCRAISFQNVQKRLKMSEVVEALVAHVRDDPFQSEHAGDHVRQQIEQFLNVYQGIDWKLHSRLTHLRNLGVAHLSKGRLTKTISRSELGSVVGLVRRLAECLGPFTPQTPPVREDEVIERTNRAQLMWSTALAVHSTAATR